MPFTRTSITPQVTLYIRLTDKNGRRQYMKINRKKPLFCGPRDVYCLHIWFPNEKKRQWISVGTDLNAAAKARMEKESELIGESRQPKP